MTVRRATEEDIPRIMEICDEARSIMRSDGNMAQWTNGYPSSGIITQDIRLDIGRVIENGTSVDAYFAFVPGIDKTYIRIYNGQWLDDATPYAAIHRLASTKDSHGIAECCFAWCWEQLHNLRIDTHRDNRIMRHCLERNGFRYCGIIYLENGEKRLAYQKV